MQCSLPLGKNQRPKRRKEKEKQTHFEKACSPFVIIHYEQIKVIVSLIIERLETVLTHLKQTPLAI